MEFLNQYSGGIATLRIVGELDRRSPLQNSFAQSVDALLELNGILASSSMLSGLRLIDSRAWAGWCSCTEAKEYGRRGNRPGPM